MKDIEHSDLDAVCGGNFMRNFFFGKRLREAFDGRDGGQSQPSQPTPGSNVAPQAPQIPTTTEQR